MADEMDYVELRNLVVNAEPVEAARIILGANWRDARDLIIEHPDPEAVMAAIPEEDAYLLIRQIGEIDAVDIMELATTEQVQAVFDFDCWEKDRLSVKPARHWFAVMMDFSDDAFIRHVKNMDLGFIVLFAKRHMEVMRFDELIDSDVPLGPNTFMPPDRRHLITYHGTEDQIRLVHEFTQRLYRLDNQFYYYLIEAVVWEAVTNIEEDAFQDRKGRMADRGFPDYFDAIEVLAPIDVAKFKPGKKISPARLPEDQVAESGRHKMLVASAGGDTLLKRLLATDFDGRESVLVEIIGVANMVNVAERVSFADLEAVRDLIEATDGYLNIGLEYLTDRNEKLALKTLLEYRLIDLYRVGRSLATKLGKRAKKLLPLAAADGASRKFLLLNGAHRDFLLGLLQKEPVYHRAGQDEARRFSDVRLVDEATARLKQLDTFIHLMHDTLGFTAEALEKMRMLGLNHDDAMGLTYRTLFATAYANDLLGREFAPKAITVNDLPAVYSGFDLTATPPRLTDEAVGQLREWLAARDVEDLFGLFEEIFNDMAEELAVAKSHRRPDVRFISSLLMELPY
ncbi:MAG: hypothetical protein H6685_04005 [Deltaproteobacteria bacterium]|nr:hypothetical protein [Deltaproteobacteria bacterium]